MAQAIAPDFDHLDVEYDIFLPLLAGSTAPLEQVVMNLPDGSIVVDLACGVGEPALTLAALAPQVKIFGVDTSAKQIMSAKKRAEKYGRQNVSFELMSMESLTFEDASIDAVVSRQGALLVGDLDKTAHEMKRVLRAGALCRIAVWGTVAQNTALEASRQTLATVLPDWDLSIFEMLDQLALGNKRPATLERLGFREISVETCKWTVDYPDFESWWGLVTVLPGPPFQGFAKLDAQGVERAKIVMKEVVAPYRKTEGGYSMPFECQVVQAVK